MSQAEVSIRAKAVALLRGGARARQRSQPRAKMRSWRPASKSPGRTILGAAEALASSPRPLHIPLQTEMSSCPLEISNLPSGLSQVSSPDVVGVAGSNSHPAFRHASSSFVLAHHSPQRLCTPLPSHQPILSWSRHPTSSRRTLERNFDTSQGGGNNPKWGRETGPLSFQILCPSPSQLTYLPSHA